MRTILQNDTFALCFDEGRLTLCENRQDEYGTNFVSSEDGSAFGDVRLAWRAGDETGEVNTAGLLYTVLQADGTLSTRCTCSPLEIAQHWQLSSDRLDWTVHITNTGDRQTELTDLAFPWVFSTHYVPSTLETYAKRTVRHGYIAGHNSFAYACRPNGEPPYLLLAPQGNTALEYYRVDQDMSGPGWEGVYCAYAHALTAIEAETEGNWPMAATARTLAPGECAQYAFAFTWVNGHAQVCDAMESLGLLAVQCVPGFTLPRGLHAELALRCQAGVQALTREKPGARIEACGQDAQGYWRYRIYFEETGEHVLNVQFGMGKRAILEFFATEEIETLVKQRATHLATKQRYTGDAWYDGVMSSWHMGFRRMTIPEDRMGLYLYAITADDPGLCKAPFLAQKNVYRPEATEITAIEYYIERFVWGGLQRKDTEMPHPYGIYGSDTFVENRASDTGYGVGGIGMERMWRTFDYTHLIMLYYNMYRIAARYPQWVHYLDAKGYLDRAYHTAMAFYQVPYNIYMRDHWAFTGWSDWAYKQGNFHELYIPWLIDALACEGHDGRAAQLRAHWETKVKYMLFDHPYPYASEMWFDSTAFESTHAVARYARTHVLQADRGEFYDKNMHGPGQGGYRSHDKPEPALAERFLHRQMTANLACRGNVAPCYYLMGSDVRQHGNSNYLLSYMTHMGGWAVLDYALYEAEDPQAYLRLGYASYLAPWSLIHTGESYPWWPHPDNRGAAGWAFNPVAGPMWNMAQIPRGVWPFDGEIDSGFSGGLRMAATVLAQDSIFGLIAYGGTLDREGDTVTVCPQDGQRSAFHALHRLPQRWHMVLSRDAIRRVQLNDKEACVVLEIENITGDAHALAVTLEGLLPGKYAVSFQDKTWVEDFGQETRLWLEMSSYAQAVLRITKQ